MGIMHQSGSGPGFGEVNTSGFSCPLGLLAGEGIGSFDEYTEDALQNEGKDPKVFVCLLFVCLTCPPTEALDKPLKVPGSPFSHP